MLNYWWVTRPKRKLNSVPEVLAQFSEVALYQEWQGQRESHLTLEKALEQAGLKRTGERRDQTGGGARTYKAWLKSLGLIFEQESTGRILLTLAGEAIIKGESPVHILKNQIIKYQFPSSFSIGKGVQVSPRFTIRPFRFLLKLLNDTRITYLSEEEIAKIIITEADNETEIKYQSIVNRILEFRMVQDKCLASDFSETYKGSKGDINYQNPAGHLLDIANTIANWLEYTQLVKREQGQIKILPEKAEEVSIILSQSPPFIDRPEHEEYFQRKYGLDLSHKKDTRNLTSSKTITTQIIQEQKIKSAYIGESLRTPITKITSELIDKISEMTGVDCLLVEDTLQRLYPNGSIGAFMTEYFEMAFKGRDEAVNFEKATAELFHTVFGYTTKHVGSIGLTPDVLVVSDQENYQAIIDNKAYSQYSISNDHRNRMIYNYIEKINNYSENTSRLAFFTYISGGFIQHIDKQIRDISLEAGIHGSCINVSNMIRLIEKQNEKTLSHKKLRELFSVDRQIKLRDLSNII